MVQLRKATGERLSARGFYVMYDTLVLPVGRRVLTGVIRRTSIITVDRMKGTNDCVAI